jgi:mannosylglycerate hydrolase
MPQRRPYNERGQRTVTKQKMRRSNPSPAATGDVLHVHILSHTHWDFEWYEVHEGFKMQLVQLMNNLLDILDKDTTFKFHFDGQVMPIMDYFEILREQDALDGGRTEENAQARITRLVKKGQLHIGPCWTTPETSLISIESLIRNINRGIRFSRRFGGVSSVFYNADAFQYHSQIPQIIKGTGLNSAYTWRASEQGKPLKDLTLWKGADQTTVVKYYPPRTYAQIWQLPEDPEDAMRLIRKEAEYLKSFSATRHVLITQGNDQFEAQSAVPTTIRNINKLIGPGYEVGQVTMEEFFEIIKRKDPSLTLCRGELTGNEWACTMSGQLSARMYLKQKNKKAELAVEKFAEPFASFAWLLGYDYPSGLIERAWEFLMKQHFHHCNACAIDEVHREGDVRYNNAIELARDITDNSLQRIASQIDTSKFIRSEETALVLFNPSDVERTEVVKVKVHTESLTEGDAEWQLDPDQHRSGLGKTTRWVLRDEEGKDIPLQVLKNDEEGCQIALCCQGLSPFGYKTYSLSSQGKGRVSVSGRIADPKKNVLENEVLKVTVHRNGSLALLDKRNGVVFKNLNLIEDTADHGDTYNYDPLEGDRPITPNAAKGKITLKENGPYLACYEVRTELALPEALRSDRKARKKKLVRVPVRFRFTLTKDSPRVHITTHIDNRAKDHRLRTLFPGARSDFVYVQTQADVVKRRIRDPMEFPASRKRDTAHHTIVGELPRERGPSATQFQRNFVGIHDGKSGLVILNKGLPEYEARTDGTLALTLLRSVGWLSQDDLTTRDRLAGPKLAVPDAQCMGEHKFKYAILPLAAPWPSAAVYTEENHYSTPVKCLTVARQKGTLPPALRFLRIEPDELLVSAVKKAYTEDHMIVRLFNPTARSLRGRLEILTGIQKAWLTDLNEENRKSVRPGKDGALSIPVPPKKIVTVRIQPGGMFSE